eukprot:s928_g8.t1
MAKVSVYLLLFAAINFCLIIPEAAGVVAAQVLFSTTYAFADKAAHDMYVLYSCIGNPDMLYTVVSLGYGGAVIGGIMAGVLTLSLYDIHEMIPFLIIGGVCVMSFGLADIWMKTATVAQIFPSTEPVTLVNEILTYCDRSISRVMGKTPPRHARPVCRPFHCCETDRRCCVNLFLCGKIWLWLGLAIEKFPTFWGWLHHVRSSELEGGNPVLALLLGLSLGTSSCNWQMLCPLLMMMLGVMATIHGELSLSYLGLALLVTAILIEQFRLVIFKSLMSDSGFSLDPLSAVALFSPVAFIFTFAAAATYEWHSFWSAGQRMDVLQGSALALNSLVAVTLNIAYSRLLKVASPVTFTVFGTAKDVATAGLSLALVGGTVTMQQLCGYGTALVGMIYYDRVKRNA